MTSPPTTWKLTLSYDGTPFHGWQVQPGRATVQGALAEAILRIAGERVLPQGSGRTDAGVHALAQTASFTLAAPIPAANLLRALNRALPASIRILAAEPAPPTFHARHSALHKTYEYRIFERKMTERRPSGSSLAPSDLAHPFLHGLIASVWGETAEPLTTEPTTAGAPFSGAPFTDGPIVRGWGETMRGETEQPATTGRICPPFLAPFVWDCRWSLQLDLMQRAAAHLLGTHDFTSFAAADPDLTHRSLTELSSRPQPSPSSVTQHRSSRPQHDSFTVMRSGETCSSADAGTTSTPNPIKTIFTSTLTREHDLVLYRVTGSGFLHHMVRNIVGTLVEIGRGRFTPDDLLRILAARNRSAAGPTAPASGLFLVSVAYPPQASTPAQETPPTASEPRP